MEKFIWFEKYRPHDLSDMILTPDTRRTFEHYINAKSIPHLLLHGPPGSGKTTLAFILLDAIPCHRLVLNASSKDRGIDTIRGRVRDFAGSMPMAGKLKIVLLEESDFLTHEAQAALRNTIETYSDTCRFILTGNHIDKIHDALQSRCTLFEFSTYPKRLALDKLEIILKKEGVIYTPEQIRIILNRFYPDMRTAINSMQRASTEGKLDLKNVAALKIDTNSIDDMIKNGLVKSLRRSWAGVTDFTWLYRYLFDTFINNVSEGLRKDIALIIADYMYKDVSVIDREINITACCIMLMSIMDVKVQFDK